MEYTELGKQGKLQLAGGTQSSSASSVSSSMSNPKYSTAAVAVTKAKHTHAGEEGMRILTLPSQGSGSTSRGNLKNSTANKKAAVE